MLNHKNESEEARNKRVNSFFEKKVVSEAELTEFRNELPADLNRSPDANKVVVIQVRMPITLAVDMLDAKAQFCYSTNTEYIKASVREKIFADKTAQVNYDLKRKELQGC